MLISNVLFKHARIFACTARFWLNLHASAQASFPVKRSFQMRAIKWGANCDPLSEKVRSNISSVQLVRLTKLSAPKFAPGPVGPAEHLWPSQELPARSLIASACDSHTELGDYRTFEIRSRAGSRWPERAHFYHLQQSVHVTDLNPKYLSQRQLEQIEQNDLKHHLTP